MRCLARYQRLWVPLVGLLLLPFLLPRAVDSLVRNLSPGNSRRPSADVQAVVVPAAPSESLVVISVAGVEGRAEARGGL